MVRAPPETDLQVGGRSINAQGRIVGPIVCRKGRTEACYQTSWTGCIVRFVASPTGSKSPWIYACGFPRTIFAHGPSPFSYIVLRQWWPPPRTICSGLSAAAPPQPPCSLCSAYLLPGAMPHTRVSGSALDFTGADKPLVVIDVSRSAHCNRRLTAARFRVGSCHCSRSHVSPVSRRLVR